MPQSTTLGLHPATPVITWITTHLPTHEGWLAELAMLADDSGRLYHKVVNRPASSLAQDRESSPAETSVLTTMLRRQLLYVCYI